MKRTSLVVALCVILFVTAGFAATKKFQRNNGSRDGNDLSLQSGDLQSAGSSVSNGSSGFQSGGGSKRSGPPNPEPITNNPGTADNWGGGPGNWSTGPWSAGVPGATSDVTIYSGGSDLVTLDVGSTTIESLTLGGINNGFTSELTDGGTAQTLTITNGLSIGATGFLNLAGASTVTASTMSNSGQVYIGSGATINLTGQPSGIQDVPLNATWQVYGNFELGGVANTGFANLTTVEGTVDLENGGQTWTITPVGGTLTNNLGAIVNAGGGSTLTIMGDVMNSGGIYTTFFGTVAGNNLVITGNLTNQAGAAFELLGSGSCGMPPCDTATISGNLTNSASGSASGFVNVEGGSALNVTGTVDNSGYIYTNADLVAGGNMITINGMLTNEAGGQFVMNGNGGFGGPGDTAVLGSVTNSGTVDVEGGSTLTVNGAFDNSGTLVTNLNGNGGGNMVTVSGLLTNEATGQITLNGGTPGDVLQALAGLSNGGIITIGSGSKMIVGTGMPVGTGYVQLANGTLTEMIASSSSYGMINVNGSALLAGTLAVLLQGGYNPTVGTEFTILTTTAGVISGMFSNDMEFDCFNGGTECWDVAIDPTETMLELTAVSSNGGQLPEPATLMLLIPGLLGMGYGLRRKLVK